METQQQTQQQQTIPLDKVLAQLGRVHVQLEAQQEIVGQLRQQNAALGQALQERAIRLAAFEELAPEEIKARVTAKLAIAAKLANAEKEPASQAG